MATKMADESKRRSFTFKQKHLTWLKDKAEGNSLTQKFLVRRAIEYYKTRGEEEDEVMNAIKEDKMDPPSAAANTESRVFDIPIELGEYVDDMNDEYGVSKSFVVRRAITTYANKGFKKDKLARQMKDS